MQPLICLFSASHEERFRLLKYADLGTILWCVYEINILSLTDSRTLFITIETFIEKNTVEPK